MSEQYNLEKWVWTTDDFDVMGWHDCPIYAARFDDDIYFDIDYVFKWNDQGAAPFTFWIAPATLVFQSPSSLKIDIETGFVNGLEIAEISRKSLDNGNYLWTINIQEGDIIVEAPAYRQIIRRPPSYQYNLFVPEDERGGISFSTNSETDYRPDDGILNKISERDRLYQLVLKRRKYLKEVSSLEQLTELKLRLIKKTELQTEINAINAQLLGTMFEGW
jgi:hypothetical protein